MSEPPRSHQHRLLRSIWLLPGGSGRYLATLHTILQWLDETSYPTREQFQEWLAASFEVESSTARGTLHMIENFGLVQINADQGLLFSLFGRHVLEASEKEKRVQLTSMLMHRYIAFPEVLDIFACAEGSLHLDQVIKALSNQFPQWNSKTQFEHRVLWLLSLGCLEQVAPRTYRITEFGRQVPALPDFSATDNSQPFVSMPETRTGRQALHLITELHEASIDSQSYQRLEQAVADTFEFFGFEVQKLGKSGDTDVLVKAYIGPHSYSVIVDAKSRQNGRLDTVEIYALQEHLHSSQADYAVVVAGDFGGGRLLRQAEEFGVVLLSVPTLTQWIQSHAMTPLNLHDYQVMFTRSGLLTGLPPELEGAAQTRRHWAGLLSDLVELIQETYRLGLDLNLPSDQLFSMLVTRLRDVRYSADEVRQAVDLLAHPAVYSALGQGSEGIALATSRSTLAQIFRTFGDLLEAGNVEEQSTK